MVKRRGMNEEKNWKESLKYWKNNNIGAFDIDKIYSICFEHIHNWLTEKWLFYLFKEWNQTIDCYVTER